MALTAYRAAKAMTPISETDSLLNANDHSGQRGFTLLELLVVLSIILLASAVVIPNITGTESNLLIAEVRQTASAFNYARRIAIVKGVPQVASLIQLDPDAPDYSDIRGEVLQRATIPLLEQYDAEISFQEDINTDPEVREVIDITFFPQGGSTGGILHFTVEDLTASIRIDPITGKIRILYPGEEFDDEIY